MEELIKILNLRQINYLHMSYIDNNGNFKEIIIDYPIDYPNEKLHKDNKYQSDLVEKVEE